MWYGRDSEKTVVVTITVENGEITDIKSSNGTTSGEAYENALKTAKEKSTYNDKTSYAPADVTVFAGGKGTEKEPYLVKTEAQLRYIAEAMNEDVDWESIWFALDSDITLTGGDWLPIGHAIQAEINGQKENFSVYPFRGNFDGKDHTISGLTIGSSDNPADIYLAGLFGLAAGGHDTNLTPTADERLVNIKNIKLKDVAINVESRYEANVGGIVAWAQNGFVIDNCSVRGTINAKTKESFARVGGLVGSTLRGTITDSYTDMEIKAAAGTSSVYAGGLAGMTNRSIQLNCYTLGNITVDAESNNKASAGGLTGMSGGTNINCYAYGNVESLVTTVDVGGLNGRIAGIAVDLECYYNSDARQRIAGRDAAEKKATGTVVGDEIRTVSKTAAEMAADDLAETLNRNKADMLQLLREVSTYLEDMTENNKEGLSHFLFYTGDGSDLNSWVKGERSPVFKNESVEENDPAEVNDISEARVVLSAYSLIYNGGKTGPSVYVIYHGKRLAEGKDYELSYENSEAPGKAEVIITGIGAFGGTVSRSYTIRPARVRLNDVSSDTYGSLYVSWTNDGTADGYEILLYSSRRRGYSSTISRFTVDGSESEATIGDLIAGNRYSVYVRAYKLIDGTKVYGRYSASRSATIKTLSCSFGFGYWFYGYNPYGFGYNGYRPYTSSYQYPIPRPYLTSFRFGRALSPFYFCF